MKKLGCIIVTLILSLGCIVGASACTDGHSCVNNLEEVESSASTCDKQGNVAYYECTDCHKKYADASAKELLADGKELLPLAEHRLEYLNERTGEYSDYYHCLSCGNYFKDEHGSAKIPSDELTRYGMLTVEDTYCWLGYPANDFVLKFTGESEAVSYEYDKTKIEIDEQAKTVKALAEGAHTVTVTSEHFTRRFKVTCKTVEKTGDKWNVRDTDYAKELKMSYGNAGNDGKTTLFIGDSFFDIRIFWTDFNTTFKGRDALCAGISATTTFDWENYMLSNTFLTGISPKNIVMDMGTNNFYDDIESAADTIENLQRMFSLMHSLMPETNIYYFSIAQRAAQMFKTDVSKCNKAMKAWCENREWITFVDVEAKMTTDMLRADGVHPVISAYTEIYVKELEAAGCEIVKR